jgi:hypothetical protein
VQLAGELEGVEEEAVEPHEAVPLQMDLSRVESQEACWEQS